ncbi:MAG: hypothetical protein JNL74_06055 [Fibrobacteres bacterium]|nr:hypothetical protein [Fibrobacterota bacterium]
MREFFDKLVAVLLTGASAVYNYKLSTFKLRLLSVFDCQPILKFLATVIVSPLIYFVAMLLAFLTVTPITSVINKLFKWEDPYE